MASDTLSSLSSSSSSSSPSSAIDASLKHILTPSIHELSNQIQKNSTQSNSSSKCIISNIENEALEHIETLIMNLLHSILSPPQPQQQQQQQQQQQLLQLQPTTIQIQQVLDFEQVEARIHKILPKNLCDNACNKAKFILKTYHQLNAKHANLTIKRILHINQNSQLLVYRIEDFLKIFKIKYKHLKLTPNTMIYIISVLEFITKDILRLSCGYVRNLNKFSITKRHVCIAIYADHMLTELFIQSTASSEPVNDTDENDLSIGQYLNEFVNDTSDSSDQTIQNEDNSSENSNYIKNDSIRKIYFMKLKEFISELNQHVYDLNFLRKLFRYYLAKYTSDNQAVEINLDGIFGNIDELYECSLHLLDLLDDLMSSIDENIVLFNNGVNTCQANSPRNSNNFNVGNIFWEFAEGAEFNVYKIYAKNLQLDAIQQYINRILQHTQLSSYLNEVFKNFTDIYRYLLPKLLLGPVYYFNYLYETIEYLIEIKEQYVNEGDTDEDDEEADDLDLLEQTLDTLKPKFNPNELPLLKKQVQRPIETSIRMLPYNYTNYDYLLIKNNRYLIKVLQKTYYYKFNQQTENKFKELEMFTENFKQKTNLSSNESLNKINAADSAHQSVASLVSNNSNTPQMSVASASSSSSSTNGTASVTSPQKFNFSYLFKRTNVYLYDTCLFVCKTSQRVAKTHLNLKDFIQAQPKLYKLNERHIYLFDGILIVLKILQTNPQQFQQQQHQSQTPQHRFKFKHDLNLAKCALYDRHECPYAFELELFVNQNDSEFYLFICKTELEKEHLMSLLCYTQYKFLLDRQLQTLIEQQNRLNPLPIPPQNYRFDTPDTPNQIIFDTSSTHSPYTDGPTIKAASIEKLIERLTHHSYLYTNFSRVFLMCYREFCSPIEFFNLLIERFTVPDLCLNNTDLSSLELQKRYKREYQQPIKLKVINVFKHWIDGYFYDFLKSDELLYKLNDFIQRLGNKRYQEVLIKNLNKKLQSASMTTKNRLSTSSVMHSIIGSLTNITVASSSINNISLNDIGYLNFDDINLNQYPQFETFLEDSFAYDILTVHPLEFARQATLMESELYKLIEPNELISLGWTKSNHLKSELSPNVCKLINLSNKFTYWYAKCIVDTLNFEERCAVMQRILDIATYFNEMNNFSGLKEIYAALETSYVRRLQATRSKINLESQAIYQNFVNLFDNHDVGYFERLKKCSPPCIPFIGTHLTIILRKYEFNKLYDDQQRQHIHQLQQQAKQSLKPVEATDAATPGDETAGSPTESKNLINFSKYRLLVDFVTDLLQYQNVSYKYRVHDKIRSFIHEEIENYYEKAAAQLNEPLQSPSAGSLCSGGSGIGGATGFGDLFGDAATAAILSQDSTNENHMKQNQIQLIENWLHAKSKQIEPELSKCTPYPRLRKYNLQVPKSLTRQSGGKLLPDMKRSTSASFQRQQSSDQHPSKNSLTPAPPSTLCFTPTSKENVVSFQRQAKPSRKQLSIESTSCLIDDTNVQVNQQIAKLSLSSADSSTPNSPPPNYDDVFHSTTQNCFDNLTYFRRIPQPPPSLSSTPPTQAPGSSYVIEQRRSMAHQSGSFNNGKTNLKTSQSLSTTNLVLYENKDEINANHTVKLKNSSTIDLSTTHRSSSQVKRSENQRIPKANQQSPLPPHYPPPPPPLPPRHKNAFSSSSSSSSSICGSAGAYTDNLLLSPNSLISNDTTSPSVSPKN